MLILLKYGETVDTNALTKTKSTASIRSTIRRTDFVALLNWGKNSSKKRHNRLQRLPPVK